MMLLSISNESVLLDEKDYQYEGLCGSSCGIMLDESLMLFLKDNHVRVVKYQEEEFIILEHDNITVQFPLFLGKEGSSYISEHINFNKGKRILF